MDVTKKVANQEITEDEVMVLFGVVSLFTAIQFPTQSNLLEQITL